MKILCHIWKAKLHGAEPLNYGYLIKPVFIMMLAAGAEQEADWTHLWALKKCYDTSLLQDI